MTHQKKHAEERCIVYDVSQDGQRFLLLTQGMQAKTAPASVVLKRRAKLNNDPAASRLQCSQSSARQIRWWATFISMNYLHLADASGTAGS
jgi:hypothetical protein